MFLAVGALQLLVEIFGAVWMQIVRIALMTVVAYYRFWSKAPDRKKAPPTTVAVTSG
ncbi:Acyltransferase 3 (fragment) [Bradyrhizobium sp. STM 3843]